MIVKKYLNIALVSVIIITLSISAVKMKKNVKEAAIQNDIKQARMMTNQLLATRHYLAKVSNKLEGITSQENPFFLAPAYVGGQITNALYKNNNYYMKQTSLLYRNPQNAPDTYEKEILKKYENKEIKGEYSQIAKFKGEDHLRYTYPMYIEENCMKCHGKPYLDVKKETYELLVKHYGDRSFNYKVGDLRGMISIAIDINDIEKTTNNISQSVFIKVAILCLIIIIILYLEYRFIIKPQMKESEDKANQEEHSKDYLNVVIESNDNAIIAIDKNRTIMTYNKKAQEIFGFTKQEMIGTQSLLNIIPIKYKNLHEVASALYFKTGKSKGIIGSTLELSGLRKNGEVFPIRISFGTNDDLNNSIVVANISDITTEKKKQELNDDLEIEITQRIGEVYALNEEIKATQVEVIFTMGEAGELRSKETGMHVKRVASYSKLLAKISGLSQEDSELIELASPMHDIGKVGIPDHILNKPDKLTKDEYEIMKTHAQLGYNMLKDSKREILKCCAIVAHQHHERYDGTGYPQGLKGEDIHIFGRITAIADVFDALGSNRAYKSSWDDDKIIQLLEDEKGKHFDPKLVDLFIEYKESFYKIRNTHQESNL